MLPKNHYIGKNITILALRDFILDQGLSEDDKIHLHQTNFDDIIIEYRDTYKSSIYDPYFLLGVSVTKDPFKTVPVNRIGILINDPDQAA